MVEVGGGIEVLFNCGKGRGGVSRRGRRELGDSDEWRVASNE